MMLGAVAGERPLPLRATKPVPERESSPAVPSNPNGRLGRSKRSPLSQGWDRMDAIVVGIDVSKDRLDVAPRMMWGLGACRAKKTLSTTAVDRARRAYRTNLFKHPQRK